MSETVNIITLKWGNRYGPEFVNRLHNAVTRHLKRPFQFVCFTDDTNGLQDGIVTFPIPELDMPEQAKLTGWRKLGLFREDLPIRGPSLFLDLDLLVTDSIDCFFDYEPDKIPIIHNWVSLRKQWSGKRPEVGNSSVFRFRAGECGFVVEQYLREKDWALANFQPPQTYLTHCIRPKMVYWPEDWVRSFKRHCRPMFPLNLFMQPHFPKDAKMIAFHGKPDPDEAVVGFDDGKIHHKTLPAKWINEHWR